LTGALAGFDVVLLEAARSAGPAPEHRHPGAVVGYVLEGQLRFGINHEPAHVIPVGGTFFEPISAVHTTNESTDPNTPARFLAFFIVPTGSSLVGAPPEWETLVRADLPEDAEPIISVNGLTMPEKPVAEHSHAGPVVGYILQGEIENQVEPDPPAIYKPGGFFSEAPRHVHKIMRTLSAEPAKLVIFQAGRTGVPASLTKVLSEPTKLVPATFTQWQVPIPSDATQELRLLRLTLPAGARAAARAHSGPGLVYVLEGTITTAGTASPQTHGAGDLFPDPPSPAGLTFANASSSEPAKLLLYHVSQRGL
jgi:quercetin dioxygenase-like cupin family protein